MPQITCLQTASAPSKDFRLQYGKYDLSVNPLLLPTDAHNVKNAELLKHSKLDKNAPTCFGLHRNHLQGAKSVFG